MTGPQFDDDLNEEYRAAAVERQTGQEEITRSGFANIFGFGATATAPGTGTGWLQRRRDKVAAEIERNRRGEYTVPTWVLTLILIAVIAALVAFFTLA